MENESGNSENYSSSNNENNSGNSYESTPNSESNNNTVSLSNSDSNSDSNFSETPLSNTEENSAVVPLSNTEGDEINIAAVPLSNGNAQNGLNADTEDNLPIDLTPALEEGTGAEVLPAAPEPTEDDGTLYIGDYIKIETPERTIEGTIYYSAEDLIRIMPIGASDRLIDIIPAELEHMDIQDFIHNPGPRTSFVNLYSLRPGLVILTTKADGTPVGSYTIQTVNREQDSTVIADETGATQDLQFNYKGIPRETEFDVMHVKSYDPEEAAAAEPYVMNNQTAAQNMVNAAEGEAENMYYEDEESSLEGEGLAGFKLEAPPPIVVYTKIKSSELVYPETTQKNDLLSNLLEMYEPAQRLNPAIVRRIRGLVEVISSLKKDIIEKKEDGSIVGEKRTYLQNLEELLLENSVPLAVPVVEASRAVYLDKPKTTRKVSMLDEMEEGSGSESELESKAQTEDIIPYNEDVVASIFAEEFGSMAKDSLEASFDTYPKNDNPDYPRWYDYQRHSMRVHPPGFIFQSVEQTPFEFLHDKEFFRGVPGDALGGLNQGWQYSDKNLLTERYINNDILFSVGRALGPTYRLNGRGEIVKSIPGTETDVHGYVLFPPGSAAYLGAPRSGKLFYDIARSRGPSMTMETIIKATEGVQKVGEGDASTDIQKVLYFDKLTSNMAQFSFDDFLKIILNTVTPLGPGDLISYKNDYGIGEYEYTQDQMTLIDTRIRTVIGAVRSRITELRSVPQPTPGTANPLLPEANFYGRLKELTTAHPYLAEHITQFETMMPHYRGNDVALLAYLLTVAQDYTNAVLGGVGSIMERESARYRMVKRMKERAQVYRELELTSLKAEPPVENSCPHVKELAAVRLMKDDDSRMAVLVQFMNIYQGKRDGNWFECNICKKHLLCHHEYLQIQQYLHPREKEVLEKNLRLTYTTKGAYNGGYICGNCGVNVRELEFDTHMELDDEGRPMMGRAELDPDAALEEDAELNKQLGLTDEEDRRVHDLKDPLKKEIYEIERQILGKLGVQFDWKSQKDVFNRTKAVIENEKFMKTEESYKALIKKKKKEDPKFTAISYEGYRATRMIQYTAAFIIFEMQSHIPNYYPMYTEPGCTAGFDGYPLDELAEEPTSENIGLFIPYMACVLTSLLRERFPWNVTEWVTMYRSTKDRTTALTESLIKGVKNILGENGVENKLQKKRDYIEKTFGRRTIGERPSESVPDHFLPAMMFKEDQALAAVENPQQTAVVVRNNANRRTYNASAAYIQSVGWIHSAHAQARASVLKDVGPRAETGSCFGTYEIPGAYALAHAEEYPALPPRIFPSPVYKVRSILGVTYQAREILDIDIRLDMKYAWQVYMKICYQGDRKGLPHELSWHIQEQGDQPQVQANQQHAHKCDWCGLIIPIEYIYQDIDAKGIPQLDIPTVKQALINQGIAVDSEENFIELLTTAHKKTIFTPYSAKRTARSAVFDALPALSPPPFNYVEVDTGADAGSGTSASAAADEEPSRLRWSDLMGSVKTVVESNSARTELDFLQQISQFATQADKLRDEVYGYFINRVHEGWNRQSLFEVFEKQLLKLGADEEDNTIKHKNRMSAALENIRTYYLLPLQSIRNGFDGVKMIMAHKKEHLNFNDVNEKLLAGLENKKLWKARVSMDTLTSADFQPILDSYLARLSAYLRLGLELNESRVPFRETFMKPLLKILFYGPMYELLKEARGDQRIQFMNALISLTRIFTIENKVYDLSEIREIKAQLKEREQQSFIDIFDRLTDDEKRLEKMCKNLGIKSVISGKDWSVGGTKAVYSYDPSFWGVQQREFGRNETDYGDSGGYNVGQHTEDE
jgi:hypothetical protein